MKALPTFAGLLFICLVSFPSSLDATESRRQDKKAKSVTTLLNAKWAVAPIVLEMAEYLAEESPDLFWAFVEGVNDLTPALEDLETDKAKYEQALEVASLLLSSARVKVMKLGLALHISSPLVETFGQMGLEAGAAGKDCPAMVHIGDDLVCSADELPQIVKELDESKIETYQVDHHYPGSANRSITAVLYGELGSREFAVLHKALVKEAQLGRIDYVVRWYVKNRQQRRLRLSGYGVELQLKSTEYKSQDDTAPAEGERGGEGSDSEESVEDENDPSNVIEGFNFGRLKNLFPDIRGSLDRFKKHLSDQESELAPLKVWQFQELSLQAAESVMAAPPYEALAHFINIAQNFPMQANNLVRIAVSPQLKEEIKNNQEVFATALNVHPTDAALFVNGMFFDMDIVDIITLLQTLRQEVTTMEGLHNLGLSNSRMSELLSLDLSQSGQSASGTGTTASSGPEFALDIRDSGILWANDIESDVQYRRWASTYMELLRPTYPGMLRSIRRNLYNLVVIMDPLAVDSRAVVKLAESFVRHSAPVRVGLAMRTGADTATTGLQDPGVAILCAHNYMAQEKGTREALAFIVSLFDMVEEREITVADVQKKLKELGGSGVDTDDVLGVDSDYDFGRKLTNEFIARTGMHTFPQVLINGVPIPDEDMTAEQLEDAVLMEIMTHTNRLQKAVFRGELTDHEEILDYLMGQPHVMPRLNQRILGHEPSQYLDMTGTPCAAGFDSSKLPELLQLSGTDMTATAVRHLRYLELDKRAAGTRAKKDFMPSTVWVVGDLNCPRSRMILKAAMEFMRFNVGVRVTFLPNVNGDPGVDNSLNKVVVAALNVLPTQQAVKYIGKLLDDEGCHERKDCDIISELVPALNQQEWLLKISRVFATRVLGFTNAGQAGLVYNGRVLGPLGDEETFDMEDFALLERFSNQIYGDKIKKALYPETTSDNDVILNEEDEPMELSPDAVMQTIALLGARPGGRARFALPAGLRARHAVLTLPAERPNLAALRVLAVLDPVSRAAQRVGPLLAALRQAFNCELALYLNSVEKNSDMPLKSFYRFVVEPEIQFESNGRMSSGPIARFTHLPQSSLLTLSPQVPGNWLVESKRSVYDLDNIRLQDVEKVVHSEFELEYLLLEGHCWDAAAGTPPRGLQVTLGTNTDPTQVDTIVMANLGYFQLKANPGAWILRLRQGRSADIYDIVGHEGTDTPPNSTDIKVLISSLRSHVLKLKVGKKPGKQNLDLLADSDEKAGGIWNSITSSFSAGDSGDKEEEVINIFSVASGHLYERFLRIMMLSVLKHTKTPVKFWFLKNYLSPSLKDILPFMAKEYGFDYELVQYKWPRWLHQQTEKQRIIWGYKILFLDVLFPLHVKKIVFVDADQIVRADMKELVELDLGGAPYGYTPFCESRVEMDGFRFWKQGYWRNHLQGRRYHISALYVVDLGRFRRIAAGDRLRGQYQALSQDPNSLSNLDQDLPNNMIHQVAIKSLPQEWLWCETWCDDASKATAKTIDLCNNPQTKEAKLTAAVRIVPEWTEYDEEVKRLQQRVNKGFYSQDVEPTLEQDTSHLGMQQRVNKGFYSQDVEPTLEQDTSHSETREHPIHSEL